MCLFFLLFYIAFCFLQEVTCSTTYLASYPLNFTDGTDPTPRQYHAGTVFQTWSKINMNNLCENNQCGPFCNYTSTLCSVSSGTTPIYQNNMNVANNLPNYTYVQNKCSNECCTAADEYCFRATNKNGDLMINPEEEVLVIFGGKTINSAKFNPECYWSVPISLCQELLDNELWLYFINQNKWSKVEPGRNPLGSSTIPSKRYGHKAVLVQRNLFENETQTYVLRKYLYVYGGLSLDCEGAGACDDLWVYEIPWAAQRYYPQPENNSFWNRGNHWRRVNFVGGPGKRAFHSMAADASNNYIYLFGGVYENNSAFSYSNDFWRFSIINETWEKIDYCGISSIQRNTITWDGNITTNYISIDEDLFDTDNFIYSTIKSSTYNNCYKGTVKIPSCRAFANLLIYENNNLFISHGQSDDVPYLNDFWMITLSNSSSSCKYKTKPNINIQTISDIAINTPTNLDPLSCVGSTLSNLDSLLFYFGGFNQNGTEKQIWAYNCVSNEWHSHSEVFGNVINVLTQTAFDFPTLKGHLFFSLSKGFIIHGGVSYSTVPSSNISNYNETFVNQFSNTCSIFFDYFSSVNLISSVNQSIYKDLTFLETNGNPCFKESLPLNSYPGLFFPNYSVDFFIYYPCNISIDSSQGVCNHGHYVCNDGYYGDYCENVMCPNSFCTYDIYSLNEPYCEFCSKHGSCISGKCVCDNGYTGNNCSIIDCQNNCSGADAGECITYFIQNQCRCNIQKKRGYDDCSIIFCLNDCSNNGICIDGICNCNSGFNATDCSVFNISLLDYGSRFLFSVLFLIIIFVGILNF